MNAYEIRWEILKESRDMLFEQWRARNDVIRDNAREPLESGFVSEIHEYEIEKAPTAKEIKELAEDLYEFVKNSPKDTRS